jgi:peptidoglycan/LPS O-acetylase OafA/YrhL
MSAHRPEVQALRAVAVLLVLVYHLWPAAVPGGFVGVDVFFAISGFLITAHLVREGERTGRVALVAFWARRARRLLPAALVVLAACAVATAALVPLSSWPQFLGDIRASALYVQNWHLAGEAVDYLAAAQPPSAVQHYWSLSAEEQFYAAWPLLVGAGLLVGRRRPVALVLGAVTAASLAWSVHQTAADPAAAYFATPVRAWEFGVGGLLALAPALAWRPALRTLLCWAGLAAIVVAAFAYSDATPFPGAAALLPVLGAIAVMAARAPARPLCAAPVQAVGDVSYAVYLWHWPLIVFAPFVLGQPAGDGEKAAILGLTLVLAGLTKVLVEDPVRRTPLLAGHRPRWTFAAAASGMAAVLALSAGGTTHLELETRKAEARTRATLAAPPPCFGAAALDPRRLCRNASLRRTVVPTPVEARRYRNSPCERVERLACAFGAPRAGARAHVALLGDSHASHWRAALDVVARRRGWHGLSVTRTSCQFSTIRQRLPEPAHSGCVRWRAAVPRWFARHPEVRTVFVSQISGRDGFRAQVAGYAAAWRSLPRTVERIVVLRDTPKVRSETAGCVQAAIEARRDAGLKCAVPRAEALAPDPVAVAARRGGGGRQAAVADLTRFLCGRRLCRPVIGGALVFKDRDHLTLIYAETLGPYLDRALDARLRP